MNVLIYLYAFMGLLLPEYSSWAPSYLQCVVFLFLFYLPRIFWKMVNEEKKNIEQSE